MAPRGEELSLTAASTLRRLELSGPHRLCELYAPEGVSQPAMTQLVSRLERDGLVVRAGHPSDGRVVMVRITDAGRELVHRRREVRDLRLAALLAELSPADRAAVVAVAPVLDHLTELAKGA